MAWKKVDSDERANLECTLNAHSASLSISSLLGTRLLARPAEPFPTLLAR